MLRALAHFGTLHRTLGASAGITKEVLAVLTAALDSFVIACRLRAFHSLGEIDLGPAPLQQHLGAFAALSAKSQTEIRDLAETLGVLGHDLLQEAEEQEWSDGWNNAIQMSKAAAHVARPRQHLEAGCR